MLFSLEFSMDNAAFGDVPSYEIARLLEDLAKKLRGESRIDGVCPSGFSKPIRDWNGNNIGVITISDD